MAAVISKNIMRSITDGISKSEEKETDKDGLAHDTAVQLNSFWAMFYAEFWRLVNYMIEHADKLFPQEMGYEWVVENGCKTRIGETVKTKDHMRFRGMVEMVWAMIDLVVDMTPCLVQPVGMQHKFYIHVQKIHTAVCLVAERVCGKDCFLGPCSEMCGGEILEKTIPLYHKVMAYRNSMKKLSGRGGAACARKREGLMYHWNMVRDMLITIRACSENALFITHIMIKVATDIEGEADLKIYDEKTYRDAQTEDPFFFGYRLREADWEGTLRECKNPFFSYIPFDYMNFVVHLASHTGCAVMEYLTPIYAYNSHFSMRKPEHQPAYDFAWSNLWGLNAGGSILEKIRFRSKGEMEKHYIALPTTFNPKETSLTTFGPLTSISMRLALNNNYHKNTLIETRTVGGSKEKVGVIASILNRKGVDDFHRAQGDREQNSFIWNWARRICVEHPGHGEQVTLMLETVIAGPTAAAINDSVLEQQLAQFSMTELLEEEEEAKKTKKKKKKTKTAKKKERRRTRDRIMRHGGAVVIQQWWRHTLRERRVRAKLARAKAELARLEELKRRTHATTRIARWARGRKRVRDLKRAACQIAATRRVHLPAVLCDIRVLAHVRRSRAVRVLQRWYRHRYALWARHRQLVVFDPVRYREYMVLQAIAALRREQYRFAMHVAGFNANVHWVYAVRDQLEWFLVTNIAKDAFLRSRMCPVTGGVAMHLVAGFPTMQNLLHNHPDPIQACFHATAVSNKLQAYFDPSGTVPMVRGINI